jgi:hypothetical protein
MPDEFSRSWQDARADAEWKLEALMRRNPDRGPSAPARDRFADDDRAREEFKAWQAAEAERAEKAAKPKPEPAAVIDWAANEEWFDNKIYEAVAPAIDRIAERTNEALDQERDALTTLQDRVRELMLEQSKAAVTIARLEVAVAQLELRLVTGDRRGGVIDLPNPIKVVN